MKTEMKKNKKMFLMAVIAAFAMISVAGVALVADDSAADKRLDPIGLNNSPTMAEESGTIDWKFFADSATLDIGGVKIGANLGYIVIPADITLNGTISIGTYVNEVYTATDTIQLTNVSGAIITMLVVSYDDLKISLFGLGDYDSPFDFAAIEAEMADTGSDFLNAVLDLIADEKSIYLDSPTTVSGEIDVVKGNALLGAVAPGTLGLILDIVQNPAVPPVEDILKLVRGFSGKVTSGTLSVDAEGIIGTLITAGDTPGISLTGLGALFNFDPEAENFRDATLSISGTASIIYPEVLYDIANKFGLSEMYNVFAPIAANIVIEDGAVLTAGDKLPENVQSISIEVPLTTDVYAVAIYGANNEYLRDATYSDDGTKAYVNFWELEIGVTYNIMIFVDGAAYYAPITVTGEPENYSLSLNATKIKGALDETTAFSAVPGEVDQFAYDTSAYNFVMAFNVNDANSYGSVDVGNKLVASAANGVITFPSPDTNPKSVDGEEVFVILSAKGESGNPYYVYFGTVSEAAAGNGIDTYGANRINATDNVLTVKKNTGDLGATEIRFNEIVSGSSVSIFAPILSNIEVKGTIKVLYSSEYVYGMFVPAYSTLTFSGNGVLEYEIAPSQYPDPPLLVTDTFTIGGTNIPVAYDINAAYYFINEGPENAPTKTTYYYTTLENALKSSDFITLIGTHEITGELTLDGPADNITVVIGDHAEVYIGIAGTDDEDPVSGTLNVPTKTEVVVTGHYEVIYGQVIYDKPNKTWVPDAEPLADVRKITDEKYILSDISTGLDNAVSGETVELIRGTPADPVELVTDATVKDGVIFKDAGNALCIPAKKKLTVIGEFQSTGTLCIEGTLQVDGYVLIDSNSANDTVNLGGTIAVTANGTLDVGKSKASVIGAFTGHDGSVAPVYGIIVVAGTMNVLGATQSIEVGEMFITGTLKYATATADGTVIVNEYLEIGAPATLSTELENNAVVVGVIDADAALTIIYGIPTSFEADEILATATDFTVFVFGDDIEQVYATQYGDPATFDKKYLYARELKDVKLVGWFEDPMFLNAVSPSAPGEIGNPDTVYGLFEPRMYTVTLSYNAGVNWVANGLHQGTSNEVSYAYGTEVSVYADVLQGYAGTPVLKKDGAAYTANTKFTVTDNVVFTIDAGSVHVAEPESDDDGGLSLIEILLIIIVIIIAVIALVVALKLLRS